MAVFAASCLAAAAAAVCDEPNAILEGLSALSSKSLLRCETQSDGELRFGMVATIRAFALEQLAACGELEETGQRFRDFFLALAEQAEPNLIGPDKAIWLEGLDREHDNLRAALRWCIGRREAEEALRLAGALWRFWLARRHVVDGSRWLDETLELNGSASISPEVRAKALNAAGNLALARGDLSRSARLTRREQEVASLLARGLTNRQIAAKLTITERTAEAHVCKILSKLRLSRRTQLSALAVNHDLRVRRAL
jgi:non-specific serine/threonine protein kinase